jgi:site-specific DNA recombinase
MGWALSGDFPAIVSQGLFDRVQGVLSGRAIVAAPRPTRNESFPLRGTVLCTFCRKPVTASFSRGKQGRRFGYYRCFRARGHVNEPKDKVERAFSELLKRLEPRPEHMAIIERIFRQVWTRKHDPAFDEVAALRVQIAKLETQRQNVFEQMKGGFLAGEDFRLVNDSIRSQLEDVRMKLSLAGSSELDLETALSYLRYQFWNTHILWEASDIDGKLRLQKALFPHGLIWESVGLGTPETRSVFRVLPAIESDESLLVGPEGFEPPTKGL